ncbi:GHKL domain-containing protein, partial [candidate division GN15 bacterium]|nr:GHKL domain-containing protein [candidate division GN15 bacterium]
KRADKSIRNAVDMTRQITDYTKLDSRVRPEPTPVVEAVREALEANEQRIADMHVRVHVTPDSNTQAMINGRQMVMVLSNLIRNSLDALTRADSPEIKIEWSAARGCVNMSVSDNGEGVAPEHASRIFDMFYSTRPETGTGIGLALSKKILEMYNGSIILDNSYSDGARFKLQVPQVIPESNSAQHGEAGN